MSRTHWLLGAGMMFVASGESHGAQRFETSGLRRWWLPQNVFPAADQIDLMFNIILWMTGIVCVAVFVVMGVFLVKYRYRPGRRGVFIQGNTRLEVVWTLVPTVILALTAAFSQATWSNIKKQPVVTSEEKVVQIEVVATQFAWYFHYPGADGKLGLRRLDLVDLKAGDPEAIIGLDRSDPTARDDIVSTFMVVPVHSKVLIKLSSVDVLHSLFLPNFRIKQDAVPGLNTAVWIESNKTSAQVIGRLGSESVLGDQAARQEFLEQLKAFALPSVHGALEQMILEDTSLYAFGPEVITQMPLADLPVELLVDYAKPFDIVCAELCGQGHYTMRGKLYVVTPEQYEVFLAVEASQLDLGGPGEANEY